MELLTSTLIYFFMVHSISFVLSVLFLGVATYLIKLAITYAKSQKSAHPELIQKIKESIERNGNEKDFYLKKDTTSMKVISYSFTLSLSFLVALLFPISSSLLVTSFVLFTITSVSKYLLKDKYGKLFDYFKKLVND